MKKMILMLTCLMVVLSVSGISMAQDKNYHTIEAGDTLRKLAAKYETTVLELLDLNPGITPDNLQIGEQLLLPMEPLWSYHIVQPGDNARSLAIQYRVPLKGLREANDLKNDKLTVGEMIRIPMHLYEGEPKEKLTHKVEIGDTLYKVAQKYEVTLAELIEWNGLEDLDLIMAGQTLIVG